MKHSDRPEPAAPNDAVANVNVYQSYGGMVLNGVKCSSEPMEFVDYEDYLSLRSQLEEATDALQRILVLSNFMRETGRIPDRDAIPNIIGQVFRDMARR